MPKQRALLERALRLDGRAGATLAVRLRSLWPDITLTETHPKVLWAHLETGIRYPRNLGEDTAAVDWLANAADAEMSPKNEHEFDALLSAWAAAQGLRRVWTRDLVRERAHRQRGENVMLVPNVHYYWPD